MKLDNVQYYSQYLDVLDFKWTHRACGMTCIAMILDSFKKERKDILEMCKQGEIDNAYGEHGWQHDYFVNILQSNDFVEANREENMQDDYMLEKIKRNIDNNYPVIASIKQISLEQIKYHQVLIVGYDENNIIYHEPASLYRDKGAFRSCSTNIFLENSRKMAIFCSR